MGRKKLDELAASVRDKLQQRIGHQVCKKQKQNLLLRCETSSNNAVVLRCILSHAFVSVRVFVHTCICTKTWKRLRTLFRQVSIFNRTHTRTGIWIVSAHVATCGQRQLRQRYDAECVNQCLYLSVSVCLSLSVSVRGCWSEALFVSLAVVHLRVSAAHVCSVCLCLQIPLHSSTTFVSLPVFQTNQSMIFLFFCFFSVSVAQLYEVCWQLGVQTTKTEARALMSRFCCVPRE